jgi:DNA-binding GntR family transcriptional regulator
MESVRASDDRPESDARIRTEALALSLKPIQTADSLRNQAYTMLKRAIADTDIYSYSEEVQLDKRVLTEALGVSRTPVREAMTLLEKEGFLRTVPRKGIFIVRKTKAEIVEMIQMWAALESMSARLASLHPSDPHIASPRRLSPALRDSGPTEHLSEYSNANIAFHQEIVRLGGSKLIADTIQNIILHVRAIRKMTIFQSDRAARSIVDHMRIIEALERRETDLAERLVRQHSLDLAAFVTEHCDFLT